MNPNSPFDPPIPRRVLVIGASGNLGVRLVRRGLAHGHQVTAFVRDEPRFTRRFGAIGAERLRLIQGDVLEPAKLKAALEGHDCLVNSAGHVADGKLFPQLFRAVLEAAKEVLGCEKRLWFLGGIAALTVPHTRRIPARMLGMPPIYRHHRTNWQLLESSGTNWSLMCPGPMVAAPDGSPRGDVVTSENVLPYSMGHWTVVAPPLAIPLAMMLRLPKVTVSYEDVADIIMTHLEPTSAHLRCRVGVALPLGVYGWKRGFIPGLRGRDS